MSAGLDQNAAAQAAVSEEPLLETKLHPRWALAPWHLLLVAFWCFFFYLVNSFPLRETDLWGHVAYGSWIVEHRALPVEDPFQPLSEGMVVIDSAWLSQLLLFGLQAVGGGEALSTLFALVTVAMYGLLGLAFLYQSRDLVLAHLGVALVLVVGWSRISTIRPENFGTLLFAVLLWLIVTSGQSEPGVAPRRTGGKRVPWRLWIGVPLVMCLWANLHGSFACGLALLGCMFAGAVVEAAWRTRRLGGVWTDPDVRRWLWLCELAVLGTLINPYGMDVLLYTLVFSVNTNLHEISEWQALELIDTGGPAFSMSLILLMVAFRHSRRRIPAAHVILLLVFAVAVVRGVRMIWWYGAIWGMVIVPHLADIWRQIQPRWWRRWSRYRGTSLRGWWGLPIGRAWSYSLVSLLILWIALAVSPTGKSLLGDDPRPPRYLYSDSTPWQVTEYLRENPPQGQVFNPQWWGDWLVWDGPPGLRVFVTTNVHLLPRQTWTDYRVIRETRSGWANVMDRYAVQTAVLDKHKQTVLLGYLRNAPEWQLMYQDDVAAVFRRVEGARMPKTADRTTELFVPASAAEARERSRTASD